MGNDPKSKLETEDSVVFSTMSELNKGDPNKPPPTKLEILEALVTRKFEEHDKAEKRNQKWKREVSGELYGKGSDEPGLLHSVSKHNDVLHGYIGRDNKHRPGIVERLEGMEEKYGAARKVMLPPEKGGGPAIEALTVDVIRDNADYIRQDRQYKQRLKWMAAGVALVWPVLAFLLVQWIQAKFGISMK